jgi:MinD-like ATPase involved in chromosome partitioning or flagellar assembly
LSLRKTAQKLRNHGINVSYQAINRHKKHIDLESKIQRLARKVERWKKRKPTPMEILEELQRQREQLKGWIEVDPSKEASDAYLKLEEEIIKWEKIIEMKKISKLLR